MSEVLRFNLIWKNGAYYVDRPEISTIEVVDAKAYDDVKRRLQEAQKANECDRSKLDKAVEKMIEALRKREWLGSSRGCYQYDDDRWYREFSAAFNEIHAELDGLQKVARSWHHCPEPGSKSIDQARIDLKQRIEDLNQELVVRTVQRDAWINYAWTPDPALVPLRHLTLPDGQKPNPTSLQNAHAEVRGVLEQLPERFLVRVREGGGDEDIFASLAVSVAKMTNNLVTLESCIDSMRKLVKEAKA